MDWTSLYLKTSDLNVFILGTGEVATRRANRFLDHGANVRLAGTSLSEELENKGAVLFSTQDVDELVEWSDLVVVASGNEELSEYVAGISEGKLLNLIIYSVFVSLLNRLIKSISNFPKVFIIMEKSLHVGG